MIGRAVLILVCAVLMAPAFAWAQDPRALGFFKGQIQPLGGGFIPFASTKALRLAAGDPRLSLEQRYGTHDAYVAGVKAAAARAVAERSCCRTTPTG